MTQTTRQESQKQRADNRARRQSIATEPFERLDEAASGEHGDGIDVRETLKHAAITGVVAAGVGALAGVAKALLDRKGSERDSRESSDEPDVQEHSQDGADAEEADGEEPQGRAEPAADDEADEEQQGRAEPSAAEDDQDDEDEEQQGRAEPPAEDDEDEAEQGRAEATTDDEEEDAPQARADAQDTGDEEQPDPTSLEDAANADSDPAEIIPRARQELERLLGREAETVSGFERRDGHWSVTLEVLEVSRVPESSDVLATYELVLDDDGQVANMRRLRRYRRTDVEVGV